MLKHLISTLLCAAALATALPARAIEHFAWGADVGPSVDVGGHDMSSLNLDAFFGYKSPAIDILGVGAGINMMVSNSSRVFPFYAICRTSFRKQPSLCFMDMRVGCALDQVSDGTSHTVFYISPGVGFNLAVSKSFKSYITVSYTYNGMGSYGSEHGETVISHGLHMVTARFGVTF